MDHPTANPIANAASVSGEARFVVEARFCQKRPDGAILCQLCPRACVVGQGERGHCGVRENRGGEFFSLVYGRVSAAHVDPIEKKPLFHFLPGSKAFSVGTPGCNVDCGFCQNWDLAHALPERIDAEYLPPRSVAALARKTGCASIAYTYSEPTISAEFVMDTADAGHELGVRSVAVSNGFIQPEARAAVYGRMDAVKIDLKAFSEPFYKQVVGARLGPVLDSLLAVRAMGKWLEIVCLVITTLNDDEQELRAMAAWIKANLGPDVPLHFSRFHPDHRLKHLPSTPVATLERAKAIAGAEGLHFVYIGNVPGHAAQHTLCPRCERILVERVGMSSSRMLIRDGCCPFCGLSIPGLWHEQNLDEKGAR